MSTTQKIRSIGREARVNQLISERLEHWKAAMRERGALSLSVQCAMLQAAVNMQGSSQSHPPMAFPSSRNLWHAVIG